MVKRYPDGQHTHPIPIARLALRVRAVRLSGVRLISPCGGGLLSKHRMERVPLLHRHVTRQPSLVPLCKAGTSALLRASSEAATDAVSSSLIHPDSGSPPNQQNRYPRML
jgi:hypothetical protein